MCLVQDCDIYKNFWYCSKMLSSGEMVLNWIFSYLSPAAVFFAMVGNLLIFIVFSMKFYRGSPSSLLYRTLASVQALNAFRDGIHVMPIEMEKDSLFTYHRVSCKVFLFMSYWLRALVAWILVNIAQERLIGVVFPHRSRALNTRCRYGWQLFGISLLLFVIYTPIMVVVEHTLVLTKTGGSGGGCFMDQYHSKLGWYVKDVNIWMNMIMSSLLPFVIIITFNIAIICGLVKSRRLVASSSNANSHPAPLNSRMAILLSISVSFVIMSLPHALYNFLQEHIDQLSWTFW